MSVLSQKFTAILTTIRRLPSMAVSDFHTLTLREQTTPKTGCIFGSFVRTNIRVHFPRPSERKRVTLHGWKKRMSTPSGREILMRRILKGRHVYSH